MIAALLGGVVAVLLFFVMRGKNAPADAGAPAGAPPVYIIPPTAVAAGEPAPGGTHVPIPVPYQASAPPPPIGIWYGKDAVRREGAASGGAGSLEIYEAPITSRGGAVNSGLKV